MWCGPRKIHLSTRVLFRASWYIPETQLLTVIFALRRANLPAASKFLHSTLNLPEKWWDAYGLKQGICDEISNQIMDRYDESESTVA